MALSARDDSLSRCNSQVKHLMDELALVQGRGARDMAGQQDIAQRHLQNTRDAEKKIAELENAISMHSEANLKHINELQEQMQASMDHSEEMLRRQLNASSVRIEELEKQVTDLESKRPRLIGGDSIWAYGGSQDSNDVTHGGLNVTGWYERVIASEKALLQEQTKRKELELYLNQTLKVIEAKTPFIIAQRRDYHRLLDSHSQLTNHLDNLISVNGVLKEKSAESDVRLSAAQESCLQLEQQRQGRHMLTTIIDYDIGNLHKQSPRYLCRS